MHKKFLSLNEMKYHASWWEKSVILKPFDFAILGAGLIGKQIALRIKIKYPDARVALIDRLPFPYGASTRNAGFACFGSITEIHDDFNRSKKEKVFELLAKRYKGIQLLVEDFGEENIEFRKTGSYEIFSDEKSFETAAGKISEINRSIKDYVGIDNCFETRDHTSMGMKTYGKSIYNSNEGMLNTGLLNEVISSQVLRNKITPLYGLDIAEFQEINGGYRLSSRQGINIDCHLLIIANNAFAKSFLPEEDIVPARGQIILTEEIGELPFDGIFHADKGYIYFRNLGRRVLIGGGRNHFSGEEETYSMEGSEKVKEFLENYLKEIVLPGKDFKIEMHWSGIMGMGAEKIPICKKVNPHLLLCVRMGGMGVALGPVLSREIADMC